MSTLSQSSVLQNLSLPYCQADSPLTLCREGKSGGEKSVNYYGTFEKEKSARGSPFSKDEFWEALQSNYDYLMDDELIATCKEATGDLGQDDKIWYSVTWSFTEFIKHFNLLHDGLHKLQFLIPECENEENRSVLTKSVQEELEKKGLKLKLFNDQAQQLGSRYPNMKDEIHRRVNLLHNKWEAVEQTVNPHKPQQSQDGIFQEVAHQMKCLRRWLREVENKLWSPAVGLKWTLSDIENKYKEQQVVQKEIESRGKYVSSIQKLCERLGAGSSEGVLVWDGQRVRRVAATLERRWHALWLRSLEWQCVLEELIDKYKSGFVSSDVPISLNIDEEPLTKYPRLASDRDEWLFQPLLTMENESVNSEFKCPEESDENLDGSLNNDKGVMVGCTGIPELKSMCGGSFNHFEIVQDVGYSSESSTHLSNDERQDFIRIYSYSPVPKEKSKSDQACHHSLLPSPIETFGHFRGHHSNTTRTLLSEITLLQNKTLEQFPYFQKQEIRDNQKHSTWHVQEVNNDCFLSEEMEMNSSALSSSHLDTNSSFQIMPELEIFSLPAVTSSPRNNSDAVRQLVIEAEGLVRGSSGTNNKSANIHAWLQQCEFKEGLGVVSEAVESSCDASGECTTNDSECEDSFESNEMNCSLDLSRSGTGSVETVVPAKVEELIEYKNHTVGTDLSPKVARSKMQSAEYPPCNGVEYDQHNSWNFSSFSPKITYDRTTNVTSSPVQTRKHLKTKVQVNTLPIRKINRQYSQGSYSSVVQQSDSGSSSFSPSSKNTSFSSGCICCFDEAQRGHSCESSPKRGKNSSRCWKRASRSSRKSRSPKSGSASSVFKLNQIYDSHGINVSDISLGVNKELITGKYGSDKVTRSVKPTEEQGFQSDQAWDNFQVSSVL